MNACQNCDWRGTDEQMDPIWHLAQRVEAGEPMPSGQCPVCGALCQPVEDVPARDEMLEAVIAMDEEQLEREITFAAGFADPDADAQMWLRLLREELAERHERRRQHDDIHELFRRVREHPDYVFGTIFVKGDFPNEGVPEDFPAKQATDQMAEVGNTIIFDLVGDPEQED